VLLLTQFLEELLRPYSRRTRSLGIENPAPMGDALNSVIEALLRFCYTQGSKRRVIWVKLMLKALLFDLDGTLANTDPIHFQVWREVLMPYGLEIDQAFYEANFSGRLNAAIIQDLLPQLSEEAGQRLSAAKEAQFRQRASTEVVPLPGLLNLLDWADSQALQLALVTNAPANNARSMLQALKLTDRFSTVVLAEELERGKPDPLPYQVALQQLAVSPQSALAFEDSPSGIRSAVAAGILTIGVASTHEPELLTAAGATEIIKDFADVHLASVLKFSLPSNPMPSSLSES
jgi:HAD superfamily hydrolase (TIGR01509 family)